MFLHLKDFLVFLLDFCICLYLYRSRLCRLNVPGGLGKLVGAEQVPKAFGALAHQAREVLGGEAWWMW